LQIWLGAYPSEEYLKGTAVGKAQNLLSNNILNLKSLKGTNTLAYFCQFVSDKEKKYCLEVYKHTIQKFYSS